MFPKFRHRPYLSRMLGQLPVAGMSLAPEWLSVRVLQFFELRLLVDAVYPPCNHAQVAHYGWPAQHLKNHRMRANKKLTPSHPLI